MPTPKSKQSATQQTGKLGTFDHIWAISDISKLYHGGNGVVTYVGSSSLQEEDIGTVRSINPIPVGSCVMVTVIDPGKECYIAVGFCHKDYPENLLPGWARVSIGFHADSGNIFINGSDGLPFGQPCTTNDCIECDLLPSGSETSVVVVFKHNGRELGSRQLKTPVGGFHALVGMMTPGEKVHLCIVEANPELPSTQDTQSSDKSVAMVTKGATKQVLYQANMEYDKKEKLFKSVANRSPGFVMFCPPLSERLCYFEIEVVQLEQDSDLVIGLGSYHYPKNILPGIEKNSIGIHCSDGSIKCDGITMLSTAPVHTGDVIGYLITAEHKFDCIQSSNKRIPLAFYKNAKEIAVTTTCDINDSLYPLVGTIGNNVLFKAHYTIGRKPSDYYMHYKLPEGYMNINVEREIDAQWIISSGQCVEDDVFSIVDVCQSYTAVYRVPLTMLDHHYTVTLRKRNNEFAEFSLGLVIFSASTDDISVASILGSVLFYPLVGLVKKDNNTVYNFPPNVCHRLVKCNYFGVGIDPRSRTSHHIDVFFTSDDQEVYHITVPCTRGEAMYPMVLSKCASTGEAFHVVNPSDWPPVLHIGEPWGISRLSPRCTAVCNSLVQYCGDSNTEQVGTIQAAFPITPYHRYFEFRVYRRGNSYNPCIGIGIAEKDYALNCQPGWLDNSIAYHLDDGNTFHNSSYTHVGPLCSNDGDQFGCGLVFSVNPSSQHALVFFTKNSHLIACRCARIPSSGFFPTIGLHTAATVIDVDLNAALLVDVPPYPYEWQTVTGIKVTGNLLTLTGNSGYGVVEFASSAKVQYLRIRSPSKKEAVSITLGYKSITVNSSGTSQVCVSVPRNDIILNQSVIATLSLDSTVIDYIGCGIEQSQSTHSTKVFITANEYLIYSFYTSEFTVEDVTAVIEMKAQPGYSKEVDAHTLWPPISAIGKGWANIVSLCLHHNNNISYLLSDESKFGFAQAAQSLSADCPYFEVEILQRTKLSNIAVGLTSIYYSDWPGSHPVSIAYYASTGCVHCSSEKPIKRVCKLFAGDVIGCGVREVYGSLEQFTEEKSREYEIFFAVNGQVVYAKDATEQFHPSLLYPSFAMESSEDEVIVRLNVQFPSFSIGKEWGYFTGVARAGYLYEHTASSNMKEVNPGMLQAAKPLTKQHCYFTLSIVSCIRCVSIGICPRITAHHTSSFGAGGIMYSSSGQLSVYAHGGARRTMSLEKCSVGDTMTCGIEYEGSFPSLVKFFHNDTMISSQKIPNTIAHGPLYSTFSLDQPGDVIRIDLDTEEPVASCDDDIIGWLRTSNVMIKNEIIMYASKQNTKRLPIGFAQVAHIIDGQTLSYYEVEILQTGHKCRISVGMATPSYSIVAHPGWYAESIAFHGDDGRLFNSVGTGIPFCHPWKQGDVVGIGIRSLSTSQKAEVQDTCCTQEEAQVFFTCNGTEIGCTTIEVPFSQLYPTIGMHSFGECVKIDLKAVPPCIHVVQRLQWRILSGVKITSATNMTTTLEYDHPMYQSSFGEVTIALAVSAKPFSASCRYVEITIHSLGALNAVIIGAVEKNHPLDKAPGWAPNSIAYHSDDGKLYQNSMQGSVFGPICHPGDIMGIKYHCSGPDNCTIVFTQNGAEVGCKQIALPRSGFFPAVGMASPGDKLSVSFQETFSCLHPIPPGILSPMRISNIMFSGHVLTYNKQQSNGALGMAVFSKPLGENFKGFSVNLINQANNVYVGIVSRDYSICTAPGKKPFSCAYCTSSGLVYECLNNTSNLRTHPSIKLTTGDTLGCKIQDHDGDQCLLFTQNRKRLLSISFSKSMKTTLYPVVAVDNTERGNNELAVTCLYIDANPHNYMPLNHF